MNISSGLRDSPSDVLANGAMNSDPERKPTEPMDRIEPVDPVQPVGPTGPQSRAPFRDGQRTLFENVFLRRGSAHVEVRAGWRAGLYVALFLLIFSILNVAGLFFQQRVLPSANPAAGEMTPGFLFRQELSMAASAILAALLMSLLERRRFGDYGMPLSDAFRRHFWQGTLWGFAQISALMLLIRAFGGYSFGGLAIHDQELVRYGLLWGVFFVVVGVTEEFVFRGLPAVHVDLGHGFLANCDAAFTGFWRRAPQKSGRGAGGSGQRVRDRNALLPDVAAHREFVVRHRRACRV